VTPKPALPLYLRPARLDDLESLARWRLEWADIVARRERAAGRAPSGFWQREYARWKQERWVERGRTFMASLDDSPIALPIATVTLDDEPEPDTDLWTPQELERPARFMSKLMRAPTDELAPAGVGRLLVAWCRSEAARQGAELVRGDVWTGYWPTNPDGQNTALQGWYLRLGWRHIRTAPDVVSGWLMEIDAAKDPIADERVIRARP